MKSSFCFLKMKLVSTFERPHEGTLDEYMALQLPGRDRNGERSAS